LEVNRTNEIKKGDDFEIDETDDDNKYIMKVLAPDGSTQMKLQGGERIFSRISTKKMVKQAKKANSVRDDEILFLRACKKLGKICLKELYAQNHRD
jgi:bifunctional DNA-binding transcriptional regulator/antitoxin component of YhaV-PrlF toxin-antitoxin module